VTPIAPIHVGPLHRVAGQALNLLDLSAQRVTIPRVKPEGRLRDGPAAF